MFYLSVLGCWVLAVLNRLRSRCPRLLKNEGHSCLECASASCGARASAHEPNTLMAGFCDSQSSRCSSTSRLSIPRIMCSTSQHNTSRICQRQKYAAGPPTVANLSGRNMRESYGARVPQFTPLWLGMMSSSKGHRDLLDPGTANLNDKPPLFFAIWWAVVGSTPGTYHREL
jgi:hypothetical protein